MFKKNTFIIAIIIICVLLLSGCEKEPYGIKFDKEIIDFGIIDQNEEKTFVYTFKNTGKENLEIPEIRTSCSCVTVEDWDKVTVPGGTGRISVLLRSLTYSGELGITITLKTSISGRETIRLVMRGSVFIPLIIKPKSIWIGEVRNKEDSLHGKFEVWSYLDTPEPIEEVILPDEHTTYTLVSVDGNKKFNLEFTVDPPFETGDKINKTIRIISAGEKKKTYEVSFSYSVPPPIRIVPEQILLYPDQLKKENVEERINVESNINAPIKITNLVLDGTGIDYSVETLKEDTFYQILLKFPVGFVFPKNKKIMYISFRVKNDPENLIYTIPVKEREQ